MKWQAQFYGSGSCAVLSDMPAYPFIHVYGNKDDAGATRREATKQLAQFLNGEIERPDWLNVIDREDGKVVCKYRHEIAAIGPMVDANPPTLNWVEDDSEYSKRMRNKLLDDICFGIKEAV